MKPLVLVLALVVTGCATTTRKPAVRPVVPARPTATDVNTSRLLLVGQVPATARIEIDGRAMGSLSDLQTKGIGLPPGVHRLELRATGFRPFRLELKLAAGRTERLIITLEPIRR